jgi:hypothetical protein
MHSFFVVTHLRNERRLVRNYGLEKRRKQSSFSRYHAIVNDNGNDEQVANEMAQVVAIEGEAGEAEGTH